MQPTYSRHVRNTLYNIIQLPTPKLPCRLYKNMLKKSQEFHYTHLDNLCAVYLGQPNRATTDTVHYI